MSLSKYRKWTCLENSNAAKYYYIYSARNPRRWNAHPINTDRPENGEFSRLYEKLCLHPDKFRQYFRMSIPTFDYILRLVSQRLQINWPNFVRYPVTVEERLVLTLRFLATGRNFRDLALTFKLGVTTVENIVESMVKVLWECLHHIHMKPPTTEDFRRISNEFFDIWNFPNTIGAIDGKHIRLKCPANSGSMFYNYKHYYSVVLQAVSDARGRFTIIEVGGYGKQSDGGTFRSSKLFELIEEGKLNIPPDTTLPNSNVEVPYVLIGDEAYPLLTHLVKPFSKQNLDSEKEYFNKRLSRARRIVECAFGIMCAKWRILWKPIETRPELADIIVQCICVLHNTIIDREGELDLNERNEQCTSKLADSSHRDRRNLNRACNEAIRVREALKTYVLENKL